jgi:hypothetical protein
VGLGVGLVTTMAALVLGLLIASAKSSFDTQSGQVKQITADIILLDNILAQYGPETRSIREMIRAAIPALTDRLWAEKAQITNAPFEANAAGKRSIWTSKLYRRPMTRYGRFRRERARLRPTWRKHGCCYSWKGTARFRPPSSLSWCSGS